MENILAPMDGIVTRVDLDRGVITVYVAPTDSHEISSPASGMIHAMKTEHGRWIRPGIFNVPDQTKTGRLVVEMKTDGGKRFEFWIEVGHGRYITDTIRIDAALWERVSAGSRIGEIVIGSLYEIHLFDAGGMFVSKGDRVVGGNTIIATI
jgi:phosphatidylserine decarboxylase